MLNHYWRMIEPLSLEFRLKLLSKLSDDIRQTLQREPENRRKLLYEVWGAWADTEENVSTIIHTDKSVSMPDFSLDD